MLRFILLLPFLVLLIAFALSNPQPVPLGLWPTDFTVEVPVSIAILSASGVFFFLGALFVWFGTVAARSRHRRAERRAAALEVALNTRTAEAAARTPQVVVARSPAAGRSNLPVLAAPK
jgi:uncharacterized integral membrane protein